MESIDRIRLLYCDRRTIGMRESFDWKTFIRTRALEKKSLVYFKNNTRGRSSEKLVFNSVRVITCYELITEYI